MDVSDSAPREKPALLQATVLLLCGLNIAGVVFYEPVDDVPPIVSLVVFTGLYAFIAGISFVILWFFWCGRNWARWLVLATCVIALINVRLIPSSHLAAQLLIGAEASVAVWLLYWLNTRDVVRFFKNASARSPL